MRHDCQGFAGADTAAAGAGSRPAPEFDLLVIGGGSGGFAAAIAAHDAGTATCESEQWRLEAVIERIDTKIADLRRTRRLVTTTMRECRAGQCRFRPTPTTERPADPTKTQAG